MVACSGPGNQTQGTQVCKYNPYLRGRGLSADRSNPQTSQSTPSGQGQGLAKVGEEKLRRKRLRKVQAREGDREKSWVAQGCGQEPFSFPEFP